jgi:hypothetical protein
VSLIKGNIGVVIVLLLIVTSPFSAAYSQGLRPDVARQSQDAFSSNEWVQVRASASFVSQYSHGATSDAVMARVLRRYDIDHYYFSIESGSLGRQSNLLLSRDSWYKYKIPTKGNRIEMSQDWYLKYLSRKNVVYDSGSVKADWE